MTEQTKHIFLSDWKSPRLQLDRGKGIYFYDKDGNEYFDASSGAVNVSLGYGREDMAQALKDQAIKFNYLTRFTGISDNLIKVSDKLAEVTGMDRFFLTSGGSETNESAVRMAKAYWLHKGKPLKNKVLARWMSYHGGTFLTMSYSGNMGRKSDMGGSMIDEGHIVPPTCYRCWYGKDPETCNVECAQALELELECRGAEHYAAFLIEPVGGISSAAMTPPAKYFKKVREICDKYELLLIYDEVMCGFGRTGKWLAAEHFGVKPDIVSLAKCISGGYFPVGSVCATEAVAEPFKEYGYGAGYTFAGNPLACAVVLKNIEIMQNEKLVENSAKMGDYIIKECKRMADNSKMIGDVRGKGLMIGMEFVKDKGTKQPFEASDGCLGTVIEENFKLRIIPEPTIGLDRGIKGEGLMLTPYFGITKEEADKMLDLTAKAISNAEKRLFK